MGKAKRGYNWKAREQKDVVVDTMEQKKLEKLVEGLCEDKNYDSSNPLVLPSKQRKRKATVQDGPVVKKLSRTERRKLESVVNRKAKKQKRAELLEELQKVQATKEELALLTSTTSIHQGKMQKSEIKFEEKKSGSQIRIDAVKAWQRKEKKAVQESSSSCSSSSSSEDEDEEQEDNEQEDKEEEDKGQEDKGQEDKEQEDKEENASPMEVVGTDDKKDENSKKKTLNEGKKKDEKKEAVETIKTVHVPIQRNPKIEVSRQKLPIVAEEQSIMEMINEKPVIILDGETGSGKTTQVPQFLYEAGYAQRGMIGVTEPRRVAAISMARRVADEMCLTPKHVSYQIRYDGNVAPTTAIKFMTDGVLFKEVQQDFLLTKYSVIIIDEAHERSVYTDILIGLLSRIVGVRNKRKKPLKLVIMSATLRENDFTQNSRLFPDPPPVLKVEGRTFKTTKHFNKVTPEDYCTEAFKKACKIHRKKPEGGILIFVTSQQEVHTICAKLRRLFPPRSHQQSQEAEEKEGGGGGGRGGGGGGGGEGMKALPKINLDDYSANPSGKPEQRDWHGYEDEEDDDLHQDTDMDEDDDEETRAPTRLGLKVCEEPMHVLPLYSLLAPDRQSKVFEEPPEGTRLCVVATNVAETSITIPNIKYVIDTGKVKNKHYDKVTGVGTFRVEWISKAAAEQRAGRAGRTGPGECFRLYSSAVFMDFPDHAKPDISRKPCDELVLQLKSMAIDKVQNFPFPTPPDEEALVAAEAHLTHLGALQNTPGKKKGRGITALGRTLSLLPVAPRYGKMIVSAAQQTGLLQYVLAIVAASAVQQLFEENYDTEAADEETVSKRHQHLVAVRKTWAGKGDSLLLGDMMVLLKAVGAAEYSGNMEKFCVDYALRYKAMQEVRKLRAQLTNAVNALLPEANLSVDPRMSPPSQEHARLLRQVVLNGHADHVARRIEGGPKGAYTCTQADDHVFIHPSSALFKTRPLYVVYQSLEDTSNKLYMKGVTAIEPEWLLVYASSHCRFSEPLDKPPPCFVDGEVQCHMDATFGPHCWRLEAAQVPFPADIKRYRWFARFLLEGEVFPTLRQFSSILLSTPQTMLKGYARLKPRTEKLLNALVDAQAYSKATLLKAWQKQPQAILDAYLKWIPESQHDKVRDVWPPVKDQEN